MLPQSILIPLFAYIPLVSTRPLPNIGIMVQFPTGAKEQDLKSEQHENPQGSRTTWPEGAYCIMPGRGTDCPAGFRMDSVSLAVPIWASLDDWYEEGGRKVMYIRLGDTGGFKLTRSIYDQTYALQLTACCKTS